MNHKTKLLEIYKHSSTIDDVLNVEESIKNDIEAIGEKITSQKGVFTVLVTLVTHKIIDDKQDVRYHQSSMQNGFSGRSIDTKHITPTLKELGLPSMAESGWLTRSLEQPYPYTLDYNGKISNKKVKSAFLKILDFLEKKPETATNILRLLLHQAIAAQKKLFVPIEPLKNPDNITIQKTIEALSLHFDCLYGVSTGAKLPVLAIYAIYELLIKEVKRYVRCSLVELGSHTASDRTSKSAGDIEILKDENRYEVIEVKLDKRVNANMVRIAIEKIHRFNLQRYYILSHIGTDEGEIKEIQKLVETTRKTHGCQLIVNGVLPTIKYYLRLVNDTKQFIQKYSNLVAGDKELKRIHKTTWNSIINAYFNN